MIVGICAELLIVVMESLVWSTKQKEPQIAKFYGKNNYTCHFLLNETENCISQRLIYLTCQKGKNDCLVYQVHFLIKLLSYERCVCLSDTMSSEYKL